MLKETKEMWQLKFPDILESWNNIDGKLLYIELYSEKQRSELNRMSGNYLAHIHNFLPSDLLFWLILTDDYWVVITA